MSESSEIEHSGCFFYNIDQNKFVNLPSKLQDMIESLWREPEKSIITGKTIKIDWLKFEANIRTIRMKEYDNNKIIKQRGWYIQNTNTDFTDKILESLDYSMRSYRNKVKKIIHD